MKNKIIKFEKLNDGQRILTLFQNLELKTWAPTKRLCWFKAEKEMWDRNLPCYRVTLHLFYRGFQFGYWGRPIE